MQNQIVMVPPLILKDPQVSFLPDPPTNGPRKERPDDRRDPLQPSSPPPRDQNTEMVRKNPSNTKTREKETPNPMSHDTMHKNMIHQLLPHTKNTSISQISLSTLQMI